MNLTMLWTKRNGTGQWVVVALQRLDHHPTSQARKQRFTQGFLWSTCGPTYSWPLPGDDHPSHFNHAERSLFQEWRQWWCANFIIFSAGEIPSIYIALAAVNFGYQLHWGNLQLRGLHFYVESSIGNNTNHYHASVKTTKPQICSWDVYKGTMVDDGCNHEIAQLILL